MRLAGQLGERDFALEQISHRSAIEQAGEGIGHALLFSLGKFAIALYLGKTSVASSYGAAGSVAIVLIWVYYSAQILLFGAEFAKACRDARLQRREERLAAAAPLASP